jgi:hypothetical protein
VCCVFQSVSAALLIEKKMSTSNGAVHVPRLTALRLITAAAQFQAWPVRVVICHVICYVIGGAHTMACAHFIYSHYCHMVPSNRTLAESKLKQRPLRRQ